jgi:hypothetical protein
MYIGMNAIHRVFEYILMKTKNIEKVCYYSKKTFYYYLEYMEQVYSSNLHQNLNQMDAILFVYKKTIFDLYNGESQDVFGTMTNIITSSGEIIIIDDDVLQNILKRLSKIMNVYFYWENTHITFHDKKELCNQWLDVFIKKCFINNQIIVFMEIIQKRTSLKHSEYVILLKEILELNEKKRKAICDTDLNQRRIKMGHNLEDAKRDVPFQMFDGLNDWCLNKFYIQKYEFEEFINDNNMKGLVKWVFE